MEEWTQQCRICYQKDRTRSGEGNDVIFSLVCNFNFNEKVLFYNLINLINLRVPNTLLYIFLQNTFISIITNLNYY